MPQVHFGFWVSRGGPGGAVGWSRGRSVSGLVPRHRCGAPRSFLAGLVRTFTGLPRRRGADGSVRVPWAAPPPAALFAIARPWEVCAVYRITQFAFLCVFSISILLALFALFALLHFLHVFRSVNHQLFICISFRFHFHSYIRFSLHFPFHIHPHNNQLIFIRRGGGGVSAAGSRT